MKTAAIICEYNPFHNGHRLHIEKTREIIRQKFGDNTAILCVMSGNFVQRGDVAVLSKFARAEMAVRCGADLVIELPTPYAMATAEVFAHGAVSLIEKTNICDFLSFGSECGDVEKLTATAKLLISDAFSDEVKKELTKGVSFAEARQQAVKTLCPDLESVLSEPNNILAIEYLKALFRLESNITPITVKREGQSHDSPENDGSPLSCASSIRRRLTDGDLADVKNSMPEDSYDILQREVAIGRAPVTAESLETAILSHLRRLTPDDFARLPDVSEGLHNRLYDAVQNTTCLDDAIACAKTKRYSYARIRRLYMSAFLGISGDLYKDIPYIRVLAFSNTGRTLLKNINSSVPVITKSASVRELGADAQTLFGFESRSTDIYSLAYPAFDARRAGSEWTTSPLYIFRPDEVK